MYKCENCPFSRIIVSENGYKAICTLSKQKVIKCLLETNERKKEK